MLIVYYSYDSQGTQVVKEIEKNELPTGLVHYSRPNGPDIRSLKIIKCSPAAMRDAFSVVPKRDVVGADIIIDWSKAIKVIDGDVYAVVLEIVGNLIEKPLQYSFQLKINKIDNPLATWETDGHNSLVWGKDEKCGKIVISPQIQLPHSNWMYVHSKNVIKISDNQGFGIKAPKIDGYYVFESDPWDTVELQVYYKFGSQRIENTKVLSCEWFYNGKSRQSEVNYFALNKEADVSFIPNNNLVWGKDELCGTLKIIPPAQVEKNPFLYTRDENSINIPKQSGFYIKEKKTVEKDQHYVLSFDPWEQKYIQVYFRFPNSSIDKKSSIPFRCYFNDKLIDSTVTFSPSESAFSPELIIKKNIVKISDEEQIIASVECKKKTPHQANLKGFSLVSEKEEIVKCYQNVPNESYYVVLVGKAFTKVPHQSISITLTASANNHHSVSLTLVLSPNSIDNKNCIQLVAENGLELNVNVPKMVYLPIDRIDIDYSICNTTDHTINVVEPQGVGRIMPERSKKCVFSITKPNCEQEYTINAMADYMKPISLSFKLKTKEKKDLKVVSEFMPSNTLYLDTRYDKVFCGMLKLTVDKDNSFVPQAYNDTTITCEVESAEGNYSFELEKNSVILTPQEDSFNVKVFFTSEPMVEEVIPFKYKINDHKKKSLMRLTHKDYNIHRVKFILNSDLPFVLDTKDPICVGKIRLRKEWEQEGRTKYKVLSWDEENACYNEKTVDKVAGSNAYQETIELPEYYSFDNKESSICINEDSAGREYNVYFDAYQYYKTHNTELENPLFLDYNRRWTNPGIVVHKKSSKNIVFSDPQPVFEVLNGKGEICEKEENDDYRVMVDYSKEQVETTVGKMLCQVVIRNLSVLNPLTIGDAIIENEEEMDGLRLRRDNRDSIVPTESLAISVVLNWEVFLTKEDPPEIFSFVMSVLNFREKITVSLRERRYNNVYCIDLGTRGIVAAKMMNTKCVPVALLDADEDKTETLETDSSLISSVTIIPKDEDKIVISPVRQYYNQCDFVFCPTKFLVGQERMPFIDYYFQKKEREMDSDLSVEERENAKDKLREKTMSFDLKQPDNGETLAYHLLKLPDEVDVLSPVEFIQNVYKNIIYRLPEHGKNMERLVLTYPNTYTPHRLKKLEDVIERTFPHLKGFVSFVPESDAVVAYYLDKCLNNHNTEVFSPLVEGKNNILIYDMGAGTLDLSYVVVNCNHETVSAIVERRIGIPIAGDYLDYILMSNLKMKDGHEGDSPYSKKIAVGKIKTRIREKNNGYEIEPAQENDSIYQDIFDEKDVTGVQKVINEYLNTVVDKVFETILHDYDHNDNQKQLKVDRVIMSGRASQFEPLKSRIEEKFKNAGCKVSLLDNNNSIVMKTCVARGALLFDSMFSNKNDYSICTRNRYHKIGIVYFAHDEKGGNDVQYRTIINPISYNWKDAKERHGMLCAKFSEKVDNVDLSLGNKIAYIIETDLIDDDVKDLYRSVYLSDEDSQRTAMNWAFVNELYAIPQNDFGQETSVEIEVTIQNKLSAIVGSELIEKRVVEDVENNYFYRVVFQPQFNNN